MEVVIFLIFAAGFAVGYQAPKSPVKSEKPVEGSEQPPECPK